MASSAPSPPTPTTSTVAAIDSSALRSCIKCHRRMSSLKYDLHIVCSQCCDVVCSLTTRCEECTDLSSEVMSDYLKHKKSLATKGKKKPVTSASSVLPSAVASNPLLGSPPRLPTVSDDSKIRDTVLLVLHALSQSGSLGSNPISFSAPSPVPDYTPHERGVTGGDGGPQGEPVFSLCRNMIMPHFNWNCMLDLLERVLSLCIILQVQAFIIQCPTSKLLQNDVSFS